MKSCLVLKRRNVYGPTGSRTRVHSLHHNFFKKSCIKNQKYDFQSYCFSKSLIKNIYGITARACPVRLIQLWKVVLGGCCTIHYTIGPKIYLIDIFKGLIDFYTIFRIVCSFLQNKLFNIVLMHKSMCCDAL